jgi:hypothetical protein
MRTVAGYCGSEICHAMLAKKLRQRHCDPGPDSVSFDPQEYLTGPEHLTMFDCYRP